MPHPPGSVVRVRTTSGRTRSPRALVGEVLRFLTVGGVATVVSFGGFNLLVHGLGTGTAPMRDQPVAAFVLANLAGGVLAYAGMRAWAFRDREVSNPSTGLLRFFALGALTMLVPVLCLWVSRYVLGMDSPLADNVSANVIGLGLSVVLRFWVFRAFVFDQVAEPEPVRPGA